MFNYSPSPFVLMPIGKIWASDSRPKAPTAQSHPGCGHDYTLELDAVYFDGSTGLETVSHLTILYWLREADRTVLKSNPPDDTMELGVFATTSPDRPNPIGIGAAHVQGVEKNLIHVTGHFSCPTGTVLLDIRPHSVPRLENHHTQN